MVMQGMIDPQKLAEMQKTTQHISGIIRIDYAANTLTVRLSSLNPEAAAIIPSLLSQFADSLAQQFSAYLAIKGEIIEVNKGK